MKPETLIQRYLIGEATADEVGELDKLLAGDPELRRRLVSEAAIDAGLREIALERIADEQVPPSSKIARPAFRPVAWAAAAAVAGLVSVLAFSQFSRPEIIATLVSGEDAAWESPLPTAPGSELTAGYLKLTSGIATIEFRSGAEVMLEAPAHLVLETPMRGKLLAGSAVIDVPGSAIGFTIETPDGYAVDHGTQFAVSVDQAGHRSDFEVLDGEISIHLPATGEEVRLANRGSASISDRGLQAFEGPLPERDVRQKPRIIKIRTNGRATSIIKNNQRAKRLDPDLLMVKNVDGNSQERRSLIAFDVSGVDLDSVATARLGLKMVPSSVGFATRLPVENRFAIYGVTDVSRENWTTDCLWEDAPTPEDSVLLGEFMVRRSRQDKYCTVSGDALLEFLKADADGSVTLIIVRETGQIDGEGPGLVHAFASDSHPESSGPVLRLGLAE